MSLKKVLTQIKTDTNMWESGIHGIAHWDRVMENGLMIAESNNADSKVIEYFAYLHDCCRHNEGHDPKHGPRGATYAKKHRGIIDLDDHQFSLLLKACAGHTHAHPRGKAGWNETLAACWDGDRLDLPRVGITPDPDLLFSEAGRNVSLGTEMKKNFLANF